MPGSSVTTSQQRKDYADMVQSVSVKVADLSEELKVIDKKIEAELAIDEKISKSGKLNDLKFERDALIKEFKKCGVVIGDEELPSETISYATAAIQEISKNVDLISQEFDSNKENLLSSNDYYIFQLKKLKTIQVSIDQRHVKGLEKEKKRIITEELAPNLIIPETAILQQIEEELHAMYVIKYRLFFKDMYKIKSKEREQKESKNEEKSPPLESKVQSAENPPQQQVSQQEQSLIDREAKLNDRERELDARDASSTRRTSKIAEDRRALEKEKETVEKAKEALSREKNQFELNKKLAEGEAKINDTVRETQRGIDKRREDKKIQEQQEEFSKKQKLLDEQEIKLSRRENNVKEKEKELNEKSAKLSNQIEEQQRLSGSAAREREQEAERVAQKRLLEEKSKPASSVNEKEQAEKARLLREQERLNRDNLSLKADIQKKDGRIAQLEQELSTQPKKGSANPGSEQKDESPKSKELIAIAKKVIKENQNLRAEVIKKLKAEIDAFDLRKKGIDKLTDADRERDDFIKSIKTQIEQKLPLEATSGEYQSGIVKIMEDGLKDSRIEKYTSLEKFLIDIVNMLTAITVLPAFLKRATKSSTFFYSREGKTKEAVKEALNLAKKWPRSQ